MKLRAIYFPLCAFLLITSAAHAIISSADSSTSLSGKDVSGRSPIARETKATDRLTGDPRRFANVEVAFLGADKQKFVFEEQDRPFTKEEGVNLRTVGIFAIESGAHKMSVAILREVLNPDVFHTRFLTSTGGKLSAVVMLQVNGETTLVIPGVQHTVVTIKRLR